MSARGRAVTKNLGPGPVHRSETVTAAAGVSARPGIHFGARSWTRPATGLVTVVAVVALVALAVTLFNGGATASVPVTVISSRAGLVMNPDAKVKMRDIQVGRVASIESLPGGQAALHLAMDPAQLSLIPQNVRVDIASSTVFGAKYVELVSPPDASAQPLQAGQTLDAEHVTVELNTVFGELTAVLSKLQPDKLNQTLGAIASALNGRGEKLGQSLADLDNILATVDPSLGNLSHEIARAPQVLRAYGDAAPDLIATADSASTISNTVVQKQRDLDALLVSAAGLGDVGNQVIGDNREALSNTLRLLVPTTDLTNKYNDALRCGITGLIPLAKTPPSPFPGIYGLAGFLLGTERYRYPGDLPKVAATGGPHCGDVDMPLVPYEQRVPFVVADTGANPWQYNNQGILWDSDALKQALFGPLNGPPRNTSQIGQPG